MNEGLSNTKFTDLRSHLQLAMQYQTPTGDCVIGAIDPSLVDITTTGDIMEVYINEDVRVQLSGLISRPPQSGSMCCKNLKLKIE